MKNLAKRFETKDGNTRISIYNEEYAENPRYMTDEPLHCEDWSRDYSIMLKNEREGKSSSARNLLEYLIYEYGNEKKIINSLIANGKKVGKDAVDYGTALIYDRSRKGWILVGTISAWFSSQREDGWYEYDFYDGRKDEIDLKYVLEEATFDAIEFFIEKFMDDNVKMMSYGFGYNGDVSFYHEFSTDSEGICWLEKDEFLKYSGNDEEYWNGKSLDEIEFLLDELEAWSNNEVYEFEVEKATRVQVMKTYLNGEREDESYIETNWEKVDSCGGFYGELNTVLSNILLEAGYKAEDLKEV